MKRKSGSEINRREFLQRAGVLTGVALAGPLVGGSVMGQSGAGGPGGSGGVGIVAAADDPVAAAPQAQWAIGQLVQALKSRGVQSAVHDQVAQAAAADVCIVAGGAGGVNWRDLSRGSSVTIADAPESLALARAQEGNQSIVLAGGRDARGLVYALGELTDRIGAAAEPVAMLRSIAAVSERPANQVRSVMRMFVSDVEDKSWYHDRDFWDRYLTMLVGQRFNRFNLALGLGYDRPSGLRDTYFYFAYPFLVNVAGYNVRVRGLGDDERDRNLASLKYISDAVAARGLHFQLGIWTHAFQWTNSPNANYVIDGLTAATQGTYCRDALHTLLEACPNIKGVTFRVHGESGVPEGSYDLWKTIFDGIVRTGRKIEIDMHAKGMDQPMIDTAMGTGLPVKLSPKFWAEHMGLPYHQASIREQEMPKGQATGQFALSSGTRSFLRYGYGDLLTENRKYGVIHRIWPGTQRLLLWADRKFAAEYGRIFSFLGSDGVEIFDPLSFKGREGSGLAGDRGAYADETLRPAGGNWEKFLPTYRLWGRLTYNPDTDLGPPAGAMESALGQASRILPLITTAHNPAAANFNFWPEIYTNMSLVDGSQPGPYGETTSPRVFGNVSSLDPQLFSSVIEFAGGKAGGKVSPLEVAGQLESWSRGAMADLAKAQLQTRGQPTPEDRRAIVDISIAAGLGAFFAWKIRAAVLWARFDSTGYGPARAAAVSAYQKARSAWAELSAHAAGVYISDITFGPAAQLRGHWSDRLTAIDKDIAAMEQRASRVNGTLVSPAVGQSVEELLKSVQNPAARPGVKVDHQCPASFRPGGDLAISASIDRSVSAVRLWYRHASQAERWAVLEMQRTGETSKVARTNDTEPSNVTYSAGIPAGYTQTQFALQYYFEVQSDDSAALHPGFGPDFCGQPYYLVRAARA